MISAILINLARSGDRLERMDAQLRSLGVPYERLDACDGAQIPADERRIWTGSRTWLDGQVGVFVSHFNAWRIAAAAAMPYTLILEDDLHLSRDVAKLCRNPDWIPPAADIVRLETTMQGMRIGSGARILDSERKLSLLKSEAWGAGAYFVEREVAKWLIATPPRYYYPPDYFLFYKKFSPVAAALKIFQISPAPAIQDKFLPDRSRRVNLESLIDEPSRTRTRHIVDEMSRRIGRRLIGRTLVEFR
jgi:glycosyl transferase family 25